MSPHGSTLTPVERTAEVARLRRALAAAMDHRAVLRRGETVLVACSGGPDSTALLDALARLAPPRRLRLAVAHVDHGLRPGSAAEADVVEAAAQRLGLSLSRLVVDVARDGASLQDAARRVRHRALRSLAADIGASAIALGHTADDQAETVLMRALAGATPRSLAAMGERDGALARPLLRVSRAQTGAYCRVLGLATVDDPSNRDPRHLRSRVRHELIPVLERVFPAAQRRLCVLAEHQRLLLERLDEVDPPPR